MPAAKRFSARHEGGHEAVAILRGALACTQAFAAEARLEPALAARLAVVVEELVANLLEHAGAVDLALELAERDGAILLALEDGGAAFDPRATAPFNGPRGDRGGGVGLELVKAWAEIVAYESQEGRNRLALRMR